MQRWLDAKQAEVNRLNEANEFYEDMQSRKQAVLNWQAGQKSEDGDAPAANTNGSGNGEEKKETGGTPTKDGTPSQAETDVNLTPNG